MKQNFNQDPQIFDIYFRALKSPQGFNIGNTGFIPVLL